MNTLTEVLDRFFPDSNYKIIATILVLALIVMATLLLFRKTRPQRANLVLGIVIIALGLMVLASSPENRWKWILGLLPTLMVGYQLFFLWLYHPKETGGGVEVRPGQTPETTEQSNKRAQESVDSHFSLRTLFTRYGLPAVLLGITGVVITDLMVQPKQFFSVYILTDNLVVSNTLMRGIRLGAVGAYVYVLLELGRRTFRHDVTGAVAMWCWVTLVLGPVLAAAVAFLWNVQEPPPTAGWWGTGVVLFFTGFAPRRVIAAIEQAAAELLKVGTPVVVQTRLVPLTQIRGIGPQIEERLGEEGIFDVNSLAAAEPVRLVRNTSFDMRQILTWIDEAILMITLPRSWQALEEEGITGAIDLAWYYNKVIDVTTGIVRDPMPTDIIDLASKAKLTSLSLIATIERLNQDAQVQYIWALYNNFTEFSGGDGKPTDVEQSKKPDDQHKQA